MSTLTIEGKAYSCEQMIAELSQQVLPKRLARIKQVISRRSAHLIPVMENIYDRGNTNAVMRSAEAFGFHHFHQIVSIDDFKESKRITQGADKWLLQKTWPQAKPCVEALRSQGYQVVVTHLEGGKALQDIDFSRPTALCFGSERDGASQELTNLCDQRAYIPMQGFVQSFNISVAAALCFQYIRSIQDQADLPPLPDEERQKLLALYLYRSCKTPRLPEV